MLLCMTTGKLTEHTVFAFAETWERPNASVRHRLGRPRRIIAIVIVVVVIVVVVTT